MRAVRERQHRHLQAAHRTVYQLVDEDVLHPELWHGPPQPHAGPQRRPPRHTASTNEETEEGQSTGLGTKILINSTIHLFL